MPSTSEYCKQCERDCDSNACINCWNGSAQLVTETRITFEPTFAVCRVVVKGKDREVQLPLPSTTDRNSK